MSRVIEFQTQIKAGLPILAQCRIYPPESDTGFGGDAEIEQLSWLSGRPLPDTIQITNADIERICEEAWEAQFQ